MAISERLVHTVSAAAAGTGNQAEGLILHLDANDVDSYDGDGDVWYDINNHEYTPSTNVSEHFNTVIYTGTNSTNSITGVGFQPDLIWVKNRDQSDSHAIVDSVRGITSPGPYIASDRTDAQYTSTNMPTSVQSDGFTITGGGGRTNTGGEDYVAWCFKAGGVPTATNTATSGAMTDDSVSIDGELQTSYTPTNATLYPKKISANTKLGFSTVLFEGTGNSNNKVPHGLGIPPELIIYKNIDEGRSWVVGADFIDWTNTMKLQEAEGAVSRNYFNNVPPTGNVFEIFSGQANTANDAGSDFIAYCFASKRGVSKVSSYRGTGSALDVNVGFEPAFVMIKNATTNASWHIFDNKRTNSNIANEALFADSSSAEVDYTGYFKFTNTGFKHLTASTSLNHASGHKYIYYAVAKDTNETELSDTVGFKPSIDPEDHFNTALYTGNGLTNSITGVGFQPDLVWIKNRDDSLHHYLTDSVRGENKILFSSSSSQEYDGTSTNDGVDSFDSNGFTLQNGTNAANYNQSTKDYVAWCFNAGGSEVTNTYGTIDSTVRANNDLGFSIVKYSGGNSSSTTVGHGLDTPPELIITKNTSKTSSWPVFTDNGITISASTFTLEGSSEYLALNSTTSYISYVFDQQFGGTANGGSSSDNMLSYCFASKAGVSKVGSFVGTGTSGNKIYTGFEPAFVMWKNADNNASNSRWFIFDNQRGASAYLMADSSSIEGSDASVQFHRDGFTVPNAGAINNNGQTHIYLAFAKNTNNEQPHLKLHLDLGDTSCYSGSGTTVNDLSSNNHTVTTLSGVQEADFDKELGGFLTVKENSNEGLSIADHADFDHTYGATYEGWVYLDPNGTSEETFFFRGPSSNAKGLRIYWHSSYGWFPRDFNTSGNEIIDQNNIKTGASGFGRGKWYHLALTLSSASAATYTFYVDGNLIGSYTASGNGQNGLSYGIQLGQYAGGGVTDLHGAIGQFRFYSLALTQEQIRQNFNFTKSSYPNGFNGDVSGATWNASGYFEFDSSNDYVNCGSASNIIPAESNFTIAAWVNANSNTENEYWNVVGAMGPSNPFGGFAIYNHHNTDNWGIALNKSGTWTSLDTGVSIQVNQWVHLVYTYDGSNMKFFANGVEEFSSAQSGSLQYTGNLNFEIGRNVSAYAPIKVSKVRAYDTALTQTEITALYNEGE